MWVGKGSNLSITDSLASNDISGASYVGGLIGSISNSFSLANSYTNGVITASTSDNIGGLVGYAETIPFTESSSYWDTETTGQSTSYNSQGTGYATSDLQTPTTTSGIYSDWTTTSWDFGTSSQYPSLIIDSIIYRDEDNDGYWAFEDAFDTDASEH
ncbi:MAG: hypothetical protein GY787_00745 [Alteromonadales bacterium]|nr:hypothetical protein [Alteromonadales bacterium]